MGNAEGHSFDIVNWATFGIVPFALGEKFQVSKAYTAFYRLDKVCPLSLEVVVRLQISFQRGNHQTRFDS